MAASSALRPTMLALGLTLGVPTMLYFSILGTLVVAPSLQAHAIYLHKVTLTWFKDLNTPEQFGGTMASGWRPDSYRSLYSADPINIHVLTFDYRGYGESTGSPSEEGIIKDAITVANWAIHTAGIPPERIVIFGQSLGSAVAIALVNELAHKQPSVHFAGLVVTATFADIPQLTATYRIGGFIPVLSPIAKVKPLFAFFARQLSSTLDNMQKLGEYVKAAERYDITLLHAEDGTDIPMEHSIKLYREAVRVAEDVNDLTENEGALLSRISKVEQGMGEGGSITVWSTGKGNIRLKILKYGVHDKIMSYPATGLAISRAFASVKN
ncbi:Monoacylglycerol lipase ABHD12 [Fusarium austroafricanum]|uniref:Monoacylglycerol lipase ABHD12 n=1 Tax=Fusarium austroafricanum TaxID=2364996 RepID=A0A8H4KM03_9HYPO|nr:Monoacylglycerol lipase ABHD12 [Fusarium austroafricanum]